MRKMSLFLAGALLTACGVADPSGVDQPLQVAGAQFVEGPLPSASDAGPEVFAFGWENPLILTGQGDKSIQGRVSSEAVAIGLRFLELGDGYWVVPTGAEDPQYPGQRTFSLRASFPVALPAGNHVIAVAAISESGVAGQAFERTVCVAGPIPDELHACNPEVTPPAMIVSLSWASDADVDLQVVSSTGEVADPESPLLAPVDAGARPDPSAARIDRDSLQGCVPDGLRRENFIVPERLPAGTTLELHAKLKDSCGHTSIPFHLQVFERRGEEGAFELVETLSLGGLLHDFGAGQTTGLRVARVHF